jgi:hypothetical protein
MDIDKNTIDYDKILITLKAFHTHLGEIIDNGYNNMPQDLEYIYDLINSYYNPREDDVLSESSSEASNDPLGQFYDTDFIDYPEEESDESSFWNKVSNNDAVDFTEELTKDKPVQTKNVDYFELYMKQRKQYQEKQKINHAAIQQSKREEEERKAKQTQEFIDNYFDNVIDNKNILLYQHKPTIIQKYNKFISSYSTY